MSALSRDAVSQVDGTYQVDASVLSQRLGVSVERLRVEMRHGHIVSRLEKGLGEDEGRTRLTFRYRRAVWSIVIDADGGLTETSELSELKSETSVRALTSPPPRPKQSPD